MRNSVPFLSSATTTTTTRTTTSTILIVVAASAGAALTGRHVWQRYRRHWLSNKERIKRHQFRERVVQDSSLVGPAPRRIALRSSSRKDTEDNDKSTAAPVEMLTTLDVGRGNKESPTIVLIHGFGCTSLEFRTLAQQLRVQHPTSSIFCYDRILLVNPDDYCETTPPPRDASTLAEELLELLRTRQIPAPYILVGHSYGGLIAQFVAHAHPDQVYGMVLIDPAHEQQFQNFPRDFAASFTHVIPWVLWFYEKVAWTGISAWLDRWNLFNFPPLFLLDRPNPIRSTAVQLYSDDHVWKRVAAELQGCFETFDQLNDPGTPKTNNNDHGTTKSSLFRTELYQHMSCMPIGLVLAGHRQYSPTLFPKAVTEAFLDMHQDMPAKIFMADQSDHWVHMQEPQVVLQAVDYVLHAASPLT